MVGAGGLDSFDSGQETTAGSSEHGDEPSCFTRSDKYFDRVIIGFPRRALLYGRFGTIRK
jgi:hypothetical protein